MSTKHWRCAITLAGVILALITLGLLVGRREFVSAEVRTPSANESGGDSYVLLFDSSTSSFVFTFTIPTAGAEAVDVTIVPGAGYQEVWFTEAGADRIGKLVYTDTATFTFQEYTLTVGSRPLNLAAGGGYIWFTEAGRNLIGRLNPNTGQVNEFDIPTPSSHPADLDIAPDGSIWFTEMAADQLGHLIVTSTLEYTVTEHAGPSLPGGRPYGIAVDATSVYLAQTLNDRVTRFTPPDTWVDIWLSLPGITIPDGPYRLAQGPGGVWGTERNGNRVSKYTYSTFPVIAGYTLTPANSQPTGLAVDANNHLWFTQSAAGQIGRLIPSPFDKDYYPLPSPGLMPTGIASDNAGGIWVLAQVPHHVYLPTILRNWE
jgi:virginiamycin B lyase